MLLEDNGSVTSLYRFLRLSTGGLVTSVQFVVIKSEFSCKVKGSEGMSQETTTLLVEEVMLTDGVGVVLRT